MEPPALHSTAVTTSGNNPKNWWNVST